MRLAQLFSAVLSDREQRWRSWAIVVAAVREVVSRTYAIFHALIVDLFLVHKEFSAMSRCRYTSTSGFSLRNYTSPSS